MTDRDLVPLRDGMLPADWNRLSAPEKIQRLYGESLDTAWIDLTYRGEDKSRLLIRNTVRHDIMMICAKFALETSREASRNEILGRLADSLLEKAREVNEVKGLAPHESGSLARNSDGGVRNRNASARRNSAKSLK